MKPDPIQPTNPQRQHRLLMLEPSKLALDRETSPDHGYYHQATNRLGGNRALLGVMRKPLNAATAHYVSSETRRSRPPEETPLAMRARPNITAAPRPAPDILLPPRSRGRPRKAERPQRFTQREQHPINHDVTGRRTAGRGPR